MYAVVNMAGYILVILSFTGLGIIAVNYSAYTGANFSIKTLFDGILEVTDYLKNQPGHPMVNSLIQEISDWNLPIFSTEDVLTVCRNWQSYLLWGFVLAIVSGILEPSKETTSETGISTRTAEPDKTKVTTKPPPITDKPRDITYRTCENCYQPTDASKSNCVFCGVKFSVRNIYAYIPSAIGARNRTCPNGHTFAVGDLPFCPDCGCDYAATGMVNTPPTTKPPTVNVKPQRPLMQMPSEDDL